MTRETPTDTVCLATGLGILTAAMIVGGAMGWLGAHPWLTGIAGVTAAAIAVAMIRFPWSLPPEMAEKNLPELPRGWTACRKHPVFEPCWRSVMRHVMFMAIALPGIGMIGSAVTGWEPWTLESVATIVALITPMHMTLCFGPKSLRDTVNGWYE